MNAGLRRRTLVASLRRAPVPALLFVSTLGWAAMVWQTAIGAAHGGHSIDGGVVTHAAHATDAVGTVLAPHGLVIWLAMVLAMSPLLLIREVSRLWHGSIRRRRMLTIIVFGGAYTLVWLLAGVIAVPVSDAIDGSAILPWLAVGVTIVWLCSPLRQRCLNVCHRGPRLRVFGAAAYGDAALHGFITGAACAASCGAIMALVLLATDVHLLAMIAATILLTIERYSPARRPRWRLPVVASATPEFTDLRGPAPVRAGR
ncbi:MAG: DUF2182 domain-containing protein [Mycetocola sp.]